MVAQAELPAANEPTQNSPTPGATEPGPETVPAPGAEPAPGQENLPPETTAPPGEGEQPPAPGETTEQPTSTSPEEKQKAEKDKAEKLKAKQAGQERIDELTGKNYQLKGQLEELKIKLAEAEAKLEATTAGGPPTVAPGPGALPPAVAKLKTLQEVEARLDYAESNADALQDFLDANPGSATTVYDINSGQQVEEPADGQRYFSREQIIARKAALRSEIKALPKRARELTQQAQFNQAKAEAHAKIVADFPYLNDPENADTKQAQQFLKTEPILNSYPHAEYLALALARGHRELQAEAAARKAGKAGGKATAAARIIQPRVPLTAGAQPQTTGAQTTAAPGSARTNGERRGSVESLAVTLSETGR